MFAFGSIVLTRFLFTDLSGDKRRPALVVSRDNDRRFDVIVCFITSVPLMGPDMAALAALPGTAGVFGKGCSRNLELTRHPGHEGVGRLVEVGEQRAGIAQQGKLHGATEAVGVAAAFGHVAPISPGQGEQARQGVGIGLNTQERLTLLIGQQLSACHGISPVP